jgi:hypothetical protein
MFMIEDLHDIDELFKEGLKAHVEQAPNSVWKSVSNDLDQKQAAYYKQKYVHLQRMVFALAIVCLITAAFVYVHLSGDHHSAAKQSAVQHDNESNHSKNNLQPQLTSSKNVTPKSAPDRSIQEQNRPGVVAIGDFKKINSSIGSSSKAPQKLNTSFESNAHKNSNKLTQPINIETRSIQFHPLTLTNDQVLQMLPIAPPSTNVNELIQQQHSVVKLRPTSAHTFSLTAFASPNFSFDRLEEDHHFGGPGGYHHDIHENEEQQSSYSAGLTVEYAWNKQLSVQSGIALTVSRKNIAGATVYAEPDNNGHAQYQLHCASGNVYLSPKGTQPTIGDSTRTLGTTTSLTYLSIPAFFNYRMNAGRFFLQPRVGFGLNILLSGNAETTLSNFGGMENNKTNISGLNEAYVDTQIGMGFGYVLNQKFAIGLTPNFRLAITPMNSATPVKSYQNFMSVELGARIKL